MRDTTKQWMTKMVFEPHKPLDIYGYFFYMGCIALAISVITLNVFSFGISIIITLIGWYNYRPLINNKPTRRVIKLV